MAIKDTFNLKSPWRFDSNSTPLCYRWEDWSPERGRVMCKVTQKVSVLRGLDPELFTFHFCSPHFSDHLNQNKPPWWIQKCPSPLHILGGLTLWYYFSAPAWAQLMDELLVRCSLAPAPAPQMDTLRPTGWKEIHIWPGARCKAKGSGEMRHPQPEGGPEPGGQVGTHTLHKPLNA